MDNEEQKLLAIVLDLFAEEFGKTAVLRGGMVLRILGSARYTNDLDYVFVPYKSKNDIVKQLLTCLSKIPGTTTRHSLNSKCLRIILSLNSVSIQIEAKVAREMKTAVASTGLFSPQFNLPKRAIHIVDHSVSLANKLGAWNERRLARDLYDIWFFIQMNTLPDLEVLAKRLKKPLYSRSVRREDFFEGNSIDDFYDFLRAKLSALSDNSIMAQLSDYLLPDELVGLSAQFKAAFVKLRDPTGTKLTVVRPPTRDRKVKP